MMRQFLYHAGSVESHMKLGAEMAKLEKGKTWLIQVKENMPVRSNDQNRYYFAILKIIASEAGYETTRELHEHCKLTFNGVIRTTRRGNQIMVGGSTTDLNTKAFTAYVEKVKHWARHEWDCEFPEAEQADERFYDAVDERFKMM